MGNLVRMEDIKHVYNFYSENLKGVLEVDGRISLILKCILRKQDTRVSTGFIWFKMGSCDGLL